MSRWMDDAVEDYLTDLAGTEHSDPVLEEMEAGRPSTDSHRGARHRPVPRTRRPLGRGPPRALRIA